MLDWSIDAEDLPSQVKRSRSQEVTQEDIEKTSDKHRTNIVRASQDELVLPRAFYKAC